MVSLQHRRTFETVMELLAASGADYQLHAHQAVGTIEQAHALVPHLTCNLVKTIVFKIKNGQWILAAVHKDDRIDYKKLARVLGVKRTDLRSIAPEVVTNDLGFQVGGVGPFPVRKDIQVVMDERLKAVGPVFCGSGLNTRTVEIDMDDLVRLAQAKVAAIAKANVVI